jgi:hypothetical protein
MLETKKKTLVICPTCESQGVKSILGELNNGDFMVQRFHQGFTIIKSPNLAIICSKCLGTAYVKNEATIPYSRIGFHIQSTEFSYGGSLSA